MNVWLGFKNSKHNDAYVSDFPTRLKRKFIIGLIINGWFALCFVIQRITLSTAPLSFSEQWAFIKIAISLFWIIGIFSIRLKLEKFRKYHKLIFIIFDIVQCCVALNFYPILSSGSEKSAGIQQTTITWSSGLNYIAAVLLIESWQIRVAHVFSQVLLFLVYIGSVEKIGAPVLIFLINAFLMYASFFYIREKFTRMEFLEKRKMYENSEAVKSILDDITEGIVIINKQKKILYLNQPVQKMLKLNQHETTDDIFSRIRIKSVISSGMSKSPLLEKTEKTFQQDKCLIDVFNQFSEELLTNPTDGEGSWILTVGYAYIPASESSISTEPRENHTQSRNYVIKFTTSFYHDNKVIVANISDTTERDRFLSLQDNSKYKTRLLASVSHELRTPLNGSINFTEQALSSPDVPQTVKEKYIVPALRSNKLLLCLINDILDFSQIEANKLRLVFEPKSVIQTAKECIELLEIQASKKGLELKLESSLESAKEETLNTDHNRLKQVILNLLSNAVKFTFEGRITLKIEEIKPMVPKKQERGIKVSCIDTGIGISEENQKKLFQAFEKFELGDKVAINSTGAGLGLVISNSIVQHLNGQTAFQGNGPEEARAIDLESQKDKGSTFWFVVVEHIDSQHNLHQNCLENCPSDADIEEFKPFEETNTEEQPSKSDTLGPLLVAKRCKSFHNYSKFSTFLSKPTLSPLEQCQCPKILIVDDDAFNLTALELHLLKLGISCDSAFNGLIALNKVLQRQKNRCCKSCQQFSIVFLDYSMPVMDGIETAKRLREEIEKQTIDTLSIICCTANVQQSALDRAIQAGMDSYCTKPVSLNVIKAKIKEFSPNLLAKHEIN